MKPLMLVMALVYAGCTSAQNQNNRKAETLKIQESIFRLFVATDQNEWEVLTTVFADSVKLDYTSMNHQPSAVLSSQEIIAQWRSVLPGFDHTHHQIGNVVVEEDEENAHAFCYGTATHYLEHEKGHLWTVVGSYDFDMEKQNQQWVITTMRFNYKYQTGNTELVGQAIENQKEK